MTAERVAVAYTAEQRGILKSAARLFRKRRGDEAVSLLAQHHMGTADLVLAGGDLPEEWTGDVLVDLATGAALLEADRIDALRTFLAARPFDECEILAAIRSGILPAPTRPKPVPTGPTKTPAAPTRPGVALPDGTDLSNPSVRAKVEAVIRQRYGASHSEAYARRLVLWWPVMPDTDDTDGVGPFVAVTDPRPGATVQRIGAETRSIDVAGLTGAGRSSGLGTLVDVDEVARTVTFARLHPATEDLRNRVAEAARAEPWKVEVTVLTDEADGIAAVQILRAPWIEDPTKRRATWLTRINDLLPCTDGRQWRYRDLPGVNQVRLDLDADPLDIDVPFTEDPATLITPDTPWRLGVDEEGRWIDIRLDRAAHILISGATRSGKSVCTYSLITHVLRMGPAARLLVADPNDTTVAPFEDKVAWSTTSTHPDEVTAMLEWVRGEMDRRKPLMRDMRADAIREFSAELPMIVIIIDEAANYLRHNDKNAAGALRGELLAVVSQGAKYGVRLILITQRPDSSILDTATRAQLSGRISFRLEDKETAIMAFPDFEDPTVLLTCRPGVGWMREVGEKARRFRSVFLSDHWGVADALAYRQPKIDLTPPQAPAFRPKITPQAPAAPAPPAVQDLGVMEISLDDLEPGGEAGQPSISLWD